jgi:Na+-transporting NADH:ubiquinone oxidoreductase subunit NqrB
VVRALLGELSHHPWEPLADAAQTITLAARFGADRPAHAEDALGTRRWQRPPT